MLREPTMSDQTISSQPPLTEEFTTETVDAQPEHRDIVGHLEASRSRSTAQHRPVSSARQLAPSSAQRPRGHTLGHAIGEPPAVSFAGRPRGHVVGNGR